MKKLATIITALWFGGCNMFIPEGVKIKTASDGVLSDSEIEHIEQIQDKPVNKITPELLNLLNDMDIYFKQQAKKKGLKYREIKDTHHIKLVKNQKALKKHYFDTHGIKLENNVAAFACNTNNTIYIQANEEFYMFYTLFWHELGHLKRFSNNEKSAMASEAYSGFKSGDFYDGFINEIRMAGLCGAPTFPANKYQKSCVNFLIQSNLEDGDIDKGLHNVMSKPKKQQRQEMKEKVKNKTYGEAYEQELEKLINSKGFRDSFDMDDKSFKRYTRFY